MCLEHRYWSAESLSRHTAGATNISQIGQRTSIQVACNCSTLPLPSHLHQPLPRPNLPNKRANRPPPCHQSAVSRSLVILLSSPQPKLESYTINPPPHLPPDPVHPSHQLKSLSGIKASRIILLTHRCDRENFCDPMRTSLILRYSFQSLDECCEELFSGAVAGEVGGEVDTELYSTAIGGARAV